MAAASNPSGKTGEDGEVAAADIDASLLAVIAPPPPSHESPPTDQMVIVRHAAGLAKIREDAVQLAVWRRASVPSFVTALTDPAIAPSALPRFEGLVAATDASQAVRSALRSQKQLVLPARAMEEMAEAALAPDVRAWLER